MLRELARCPSEPRGGDGGFQGGAGARLTAEHVRAQSKELARLSREAGLTYWLDVAAFEAENQLKDKGGWSYSLD
jgi:hypothetical protein